MIVVAYATNKVVFVLMAAFSRSKQVDAWRQLLICQARMVRLIEHELESRELIPLTFYDVLLQLRYAPDRTLRFRDLNGEIVLSRSALSRAIDRMVEQQLVSKLDCPEDPRGLLLQMTSEGENALKAAWPVYRRRIEGLFGKHFNEAELNFLTAKLSAVNESLKQIK
jgi:DNA-binding MarR family transcriptional regulator